MRSVFSITVLAIVAALFITPVFAQKQKSKEEAFNEIAKLTNTKKPEDLDKAYKLAREFVTRFAKDKDDKVKHIGDFVKKYRLNIFLKAVDLNTPVEAFALGKEILGEEPENTEVLMNLAHAGYNARNTKGDKTFTDDSVAYAAKTLEMLAAGKLPPTFAPYKDQNEATAWMHFINAFLTFDKDMKVAAASAYKAIQFETPIKNDALPYFMISAFYEDQYAKLSTAKGDAAKINEAIDLMLDAYARTCKRAEAAKNPNNEQWKARFAQIYKFRKKTDAGLAEYMAAIDSTPMADPGKF
jgi:hypothetical protein